jgi:hypothetical protein
VNNRSILDVRIVANRDGMNVSAHNRIVPDGAIITHHHFTDYHCRFSQEAIGPKRGSYTPQGSDYCHSILFAPI